MIIVKRDSISLIRSMCFIESHAGMFSALMFSESESIEISNVSHIIELMSILLTSIEYLIEKLNVFFSA